MFNCNDYKTGAISHIAIIVLHKSKLINTDFSTNV